MPSLRAPLCGANNKENYCLDLNTTKTTRCIQRSIHHNFKSRDVGASEKLWDNPFKQILQVIFPRNTVDYVDPVLSHREGMADVGSKKSF